MARQDTGRWVQRAASTGGSRAYRGQRPVKWYTSLVLICILGAALVWYSRYERQHPSSAGQPAVGTTWYAAYAFDICGTVEPPLPANPSTKGGPPGLTTTGNGVITIAPKKASQAGANATLGAFAAGYKGMVLTSASIRYPGKTSAGPTVGRTFQLGDRCPKGTPDAGRRGVVQVDLWTSPSATKPQIVGDPPTLRIGDEQEVTMAFVPQGTSVPRPNGTAVTAMLQLASGQGASSGAAPTGSTPTGSTPASGSSVPSGSAPSTGSSASTGSAPSTGSSASTGSAPSTGSSASSSGTPASGSASVSGTSGPGPAGSSG
jgi:hypothetical protein